jgi:hypothetical protein
VVIETPIPNGKRATRRGRRSLPRRIGGRENEDGIESDDGIKER